MDSPFEKLTDGGRKVLQLAQEEATRLGDNYICTGHLLLGLLREGDGVAAKVLTSLGVDFNSVRNAVLINRGSMSVGTDRGGLTPEAKKAIKVSVDEARHRRHAYLGTEHLLLGVCSDGEGTAGRVLGSLGISVDKIRSEVAHVLNDEA